MPTRRFNRSQASRIELPVTGNTRSLVRGVAFSISIAFALSGIVRGEPFFVIAMETV